MSRTEQAAQHLRQAQREKILDAARQVFARKGILATMDDIAAAASISHGLAYRYFTNKDAIIHALIAQAIQQSGGLRQALELPGTPGERLAVLLTTMLERRRERPEFYQVLSQILHESTISDEFGQVVRQYRRDLYGALRHLIIEGQATGEIAPDDPDQLVTAMLACLDGLTNWSAHETHFPAAKILLRMLKP